MRRGSRWAGTALLVFTAWLALSAAAAAREPRSAVTVGVDPAGRGEKCAEEEERAILGLQGCAKEPVTLPTWLGPVPDLGSNREGPRGKERARDVLGRLHSPAYLARLEAEKNRLEREVFGDALETLPETSELRTAASNGLAPTERIYLFISESIPLETLRNYARDIAEIGDPGIVMVLRGLVGGMRHVLPTRRFVLDVLRKDIVCDPDAKEDCELCPVNLVVDPLLFRRYDIQKTPAVVYAKNMEVTRFDAGEGQPVNTGAGRFWRISGDAKLTYLIRRINKDARSEALTTLHDPKK